MSTKTYYEINKEGQIIGQFGQQPNAHNNLNVVHATPPPEAMLKPRWVGSADAGQWVDAATRAEHEERIDFETSVAVKTWCREKGKCEDYYINCGIRVAIGNVVDTTDIDYRHYHEYRACVDAQKKLGKVKKAALS